jgi:hypothetical protein
MPRAKRTGKAEEFDELLVVVDVDVFSKQTILIPRQPTLRRWSGYLQYLGYLHECFQTVTGYSRQKNGIDL